MSNYINERSVLGLMNGRAFLTSSAGDRLAFSKTKSESKIVLFSFREEDKEKLSEKEVSYMYLDEKPDIPRAHWLTQVESEFEPEYFLSLSRKTDKEMFQTFRKFSTKKELKVIELDEDNIQEMEPKLDRMISIWQISAKGGMKYMWQEHAGIDKAFFKRYSEEPGKFEKEFRTLLFFWMGELVGYSVIEREPDESGEHKYIIRKVLVEHEGFRNITEYVDFVTFKRVFEENGRKRFSVNWGASSKGVLWYKMHKWPLKAASKKWFALLKKKS